MNNLKNVKSELHYYLDIVQGIILIISFLFVTTAKVSKLDLIYGKFLPEQAYAICVQPHIPI